MNAVLAEECCFLEYQSGMALWFDGSYDSAVSGAARNVIKLPCVIDIDPKLPLCGINRPSLPRASEQQDEEKGELSIIKPIDDLSDSTIQILGSHGYKRFLDFMKYTQGWDEFNQPEVTKGKHNDSLALSNFNHFYGADILRVTRTG